MSPDSVMLKRPSFSFWYTAMAPKAKLEPMIMAQIA